jgi:hypothetical protein
LGAYALDAHNDGGTAFAPLILLCFDRHISQFNAEHPVGHYPCRAPFQQRCPYRCVISDGVPHAPDCRFDLGRTAVAVPDRDIAQQGFCDDAHPSDRSPLS